MAAPKADEPKKVYTYRATPSSVEKASKKAKKHKQTLSTIIQWFINEYAN